MKEPTETWGTQSMLTVLVLILIAIAIYEIVARLKDGRWITPDFTRRRERL
jgi:hypothetical protein